MEKLACCSFVRRCFINTNRGTIHNDAWVEHQTFSSTAGTQGYLMTPKQRESIPNFQEHNICSLRKRGTLQPSAMMTSSNKSSTALTFCNWTLRMENGRFCAMASHFFSMPRTMGSLVPSPKGTSELNSTFNGRI